METDEYTRLTASRLGECLSFEEAWAKYGGTWHVEYADGTSFSGVKPPEERQRPKLRLIQGGKADA